MKSRTSLFDKGLFRYLVRRGAVLWGVLFVLEFLTLDMPLYTVQRAHFDMFMIERLLSIAHNCSFAAVIVSFFAVRRVFSYMMTIRGSGMIASLPIRRESVFVTSFLAGLLPPMAVTAMTGAMTLIGLPVIRPEYISTLLIFFSAAMLTYLTFYCSFTLCAQLTGTGSGILLAFLILNFAFGLVRVTSNELLSELIRGLDFSEGFLYDYVPMFRISDALRLSYTADGRPLSFTYTFLGKDSDIAIYGMKELIIETALRLPLALLALLLYRKRHMESASDLVALRPLRPVFRYLMALICALTTAYLLYFGFFSVLHGRAAALCIAALLATGAFIGYFGSLMLMEKTAKVFKDHWRGYVIAAAALCIACIGADVCSGRFENTVPQVENVESVKIYCSNTTTKTVLREPENIENVIRLHREILDREEGHGSVMVIEYKLTDGGTLRRSYPLPQQEQGAYIDTKLGHIFNAKEGILYRNVPAPLLAGEAISSGKVKRSGNTTKLDADEMTEFFYSCILPDLEEGKLGTVYFSNSKLNTASSQTDTTVYIYAEGEQTYINVRLTAQRTFQWLLEHGIYVVKITNDVR